MGFRVKKGIGVSYERQGYIYFTSRNYARLSKEQKDKIDKLCQACAGEHAQALFEFVTTGKGAAAICLKYFIASRTTLDRAVRRYYQQFPVKL